MRLPLILMVLVCVPFAVALPSYIAKKRGTKERKMIRILALVGFFFPVVALLISMSSLHEMRSETFFMLAGVGFVFWLVALIWSIAGEVNELSRGFAVIVDQQVNDRPLP